MGVWAVIWGPLVVGLVLWVLAEGARSWWLVVGGRAKRRRQIISLMGRAVAVESRAMNDGQFDEAWISNSERALAESRSTYDDLTAQALDLFEPGEEVVALWTAAEFYAGWYSPLQALRHDNVPRERSANGGNLLHTSSLYRQWVFARPAELAAWARVRWPWDRGNARGPRYADLHTPGDRSRHDIVVPNSDVNADMLMPYVLLLASPWSKLSDRETKRLSSKYPPIHNSKQGAHSVR